MYFVRCVILRNETSKTDRFSAGVCALTRARNFVEIHTISGDIAPAAMFGFVPGTSSAGTTVLLLHHDDARIAFTLRNRRPAKKNQAV